MKLLTTTLFLISTHFLFGQADNFSCSKVTDKIKITGDTVFYDNSFIDKNKKIGHIKESKADFEIRYYYTPSLVNGGHVTIINCTGDNIKGKKINYWFSVKQDYDKAKIYKTKITELTPLNSWDNFFDSLEIMNFYRFPTMETIRPKMKKFVTRADGRVVEKRSMITDGANYTFEIKIGNIIRSFTYHSPDAWYRAYDNVDELRQATEIIEFFKTNLREGNSP
jgi:hypothetical protein